MKSLALVCSIFFVCGSDRQICGQTSDSSRYFPVNVGDKWQWYSYNDSSRSTNEITHDSIDIHGTRFIFFNGSTIPSYSLDAQDRVYQFLNMTDSFGHVTPGSPLLLYKLDAPEGDNYWTNDSNGLVKVTIFRTSIFGRPVNVKMFNWYAMPGNYWFFSLSLAWGFGLVQTDGPFPGTLTGCRIDNVDYGTLLSVISQQTGLPRESRLDQNYPNPFNPSTRIDFKIPSSSFVSLRVYNALGMLVATLASKEFKPGNYSVSWDASGLPSGVYFYRLSAGSFVETKKLILLR